ncbi:MAG TPA: hypothetical protein VFW33_01995 [Gemmataceae bacterium]|nr:hypothetical protein [Gemmataceae bacterium]
MNRDDIINRLKATRAPKPRPAADRQAGLKRLAQERNQMGKAAGRKWAEEAATFNQLQQLAGMHDRATRAVLGPNWEDGFWRKVLGPVQATVIQDGGADFLRGLTDGALELWNEVRELV